MGTPIEIRHTCLVKLTGSGTALPEAAVGSDGRTRDAVARLVQQSGPLTAAALAERLHLSPAAVRRHLDALVADGLHRGRAPGPALRPRGRGRPARTFALTDAGRAAFGHAYDDLASTALRYLRETGGEAAVHGVRRARPAPGRPDRSRLAATVEPLAAAPSEAGAGRRGADRRGLRRHDRAGRPAAPRSASTTARWPTWPRSSRSCARPRPGRFAAGGHPRPAAGHHRPRRRRLHHARPRPSADTNTVNQAPSQHGRQFSDHCSRAHPSPRTSRSTRCRLQASAGPTPTSPAPPPGAACPRRWCATSRR